jgi:aminopeptidase N
MRFSLAFVILILFFTSCKKQQSPPNQTGISLDLAEFRKENLSDIQYRLHFDIPAEKEKPIPAKLNLSFKLKNSIDELQIDFNEATDKLQSIWVNGVELEIRHEKEHILIPGKQLKRGQNEIKIDFFAGERSLNRSADFLYTLLVPDRASTVFPAFDQPDLKSMFSLSLSIPEAWVAMANAPAITSGIENEIKTIQFAETERIPSYLFSFVAGKFQVISDEKDDFPITMFHRESDSAKVARNAPEIFKLHRQSLAWLEEYTGIKYPYQKFDFALIPPFQYGGMEHVGAIQYRASSLMLDENASQQQQLGRASLIAHETAHMWFGDLVTMNWFDDVWLKEVFANFMAAKMVNPSFPELNHDLRFLLAHHPAAYSVDRTAGKHPIKQELENLKQAGNLYGPIIYQKAPIMMRQLEALVGESAFQLSLQEYLRKFAHDNAKWEDLVQIFDKNSQKNIKEWSHLWVNEARMPVFTFAIDQKTLRISQQSESFLPQRFQISLLNPGQRKDISVWMDELEMELELDESWQFLIPNSDGMGYGYFPVSSETAELIPAFEDPILRAAAYLSLYEGLLRGDLDPNFCLEVWFDAARSEKDMQLSSRVMGMVQSVYWRYISESQRMALAADWEEMILGRLMESPTSGEKSSWFSAYLSMAHTSAATSKMENWWRDQKEIMGLKLSESDYTSLAAALALRGVPGSLTIIEEQLGRITNPDNKKRWEFVSKALHTDLAQRDAFFASLKNAENRQYEPWVTQALSYLNHPTRQQEAIKYLPEVLALLQEIQITGDIFFPKAWLDAGFSGHNSPEAADIIRNFIQENPDYNPRLKGKLLQAADPVFRSEQILKNTKPM